MNDQSKFWDKMALRYSKCQIDDEGAYQTKLDVTRQYFRPDTAVLEIGCGTGSTAILHAPFVKHILATDISSKMLEIANSKLAPDGPTNVTFQVTNIDALAQADDHFDAVLAMNVLHLLEDHDQFIQKVHGLLKPGGYFVSSTACMGDTMKFMKFIAPIGQFLGKFPTLAIFTKQQLLNSLTNAGFEIDHKWQPAKGKALFVVAKKPDA
jgi:ubiquinone/menaquinone biosynthesis C-methylase UbiE